MNLEQRVRDELVRTAPTTVPEAPTLATLRDVVGRRRRRNRILTGLAGAAVVVVVAAAVVVERSDSPVAVVTAGDDTEQQADSAEPADQADRADGSDTAEDGGATADAAAIDSSSGETSAAENSTAGLQASTEPVNVETRASAVEFSGGSGVFVVPTDDGYAGLASRFGAGGVEMIGLESGDGLGWTEVELTGVPAGATATHLRQFDGSHVALFSRFDPDEQRTVVTVSTSADLVEWKTVAVLPDDVVATDIAVGPAGLLILGDGRAPAVWAGPVTGPVERVGAIDDASTVAGLVAIDEGFVAAGTSGGDPFLFESADGTEWRPIAVSGLAGDDAVIELAVDDGVITIAGGGDQAWMAASSDGGQTWSRSELVRATVDSVAARGRSMSFLGTSPLGAPTVTMSDGSTWSSTELDVAPGDRVELLSAGNPTILLAAGEDGLTWLVASR